MTRNEVIEKYFTNISLHRDYLDLYYVRRSLLNAIKENMNRFHGSILDVGCGIMPYKELIVANNKNVTAYVGLDFENSIDHEYELGKPDLFWTGVVIPLENNSVDTVLATEFFEHCADPEKIMLEILRVLKPGGLLFITVPFLWNLHTVPHDEYRYTPYSLERHLKNANFVNIELKSLGGWDASLAQMLALWHRQRPMRKFIKRILAYILIPIIRKLINTDYKWKYKNRFGNGDMFTGLVATAIKGKS